MKNNHHTRRRHYTTRKSKARREIITLALLAVVFVALVAYTIFKPRPGMAQPDLGNAHIAPPVTAVYNTTPPTSGLHYGYIAEWGIHTEPVQNEVQVHNLEDGGVMVQYRCEAEPECGTLIAQLSAIVERYDSQVILAPYPDMDHRIALTAWTVLDAFDDFDEERVTKFIEAYRGIDHHN